MWGGLQWPENRAQEVEKKTKERERDSSTSSREGLSVGDVMVDAGPEF